LVVGFLFAYTSTIYLLAMRSAVSSVAKAMAADEEEAAFGGACV